MTLAGCVWAAGKGREGVEGPEVRGTTRTFVMVMAAEAVTGKHLVYTIGRSGRGEGEDMRQGLEGVGIKGGISDA